MAWQRRSEQTQRTSPVVEPSLNSNQRNVQKDYEKLFCKILQLTDYVCLTFSDGTEFNEPNVAFSYFYTVTNRLSYFHIFLLSKLVKGYYTLTNLPKTCQST